MQITNYKDSLNQIVCENSTADCYLDKCEKCPGTEKVSEHLLNLLEEKSISHVEFCIWSASDRSTLIKQRMNIEDFVNELCNRLRILKPHSFIAKQQTDFINKKKGFEKRKSYCYI